jgi:hypothetical protein
MSYEREKTRGYYFCLGVMLSPIITILLIPLFSSGLSQLPYAVLMIVIVVVPLLGCGFDLRGRPLFQSHYHGEPFIDEVMNILEDEQVT